jgi:hypothetical protein
LGFSRSSTLRLVEAGLIRYVRGPERDFPIGDHFCREDVQNIKRTFERHGLPVCTCSRAKGTISLRDGIRIYTGRLGLPSLIRAVMNGSLIPVARTTQLPGITGFLFRCEQIRMHRPNVRTLTPPEGFVTYKQAASMLGTNAEVIRNLVAQRIVSSSEHRFNRSKLVLLADLQKFAKHYVSIRSVADRFDERSERVARYLRERGTKILAIHLPGKGRKLFVSSRVAAQVWLPPVKTAMPGP